MSGRGERNQWLSLGPDPGVLPCAPARWGGGSWPGCPAVAEGRTPDQGHMATLLPPALTPRSVPSPRRARHRPQNQPPPSARLKTPAPSPHRSPTLTRPPAPATPHLHPTPAGACAAGRGGGTSLSASANHRAALRCRRPIAARPAVQGWVGRSGFSRFPRLGAVGSVQTQGRGRWEVP